MQSVYIAGASSGSGKSVVILGFMEMLSAVNRKVGFFRPIVRQSVEQDDLTNLIRSRYDLPFPAEMLYGCTVGDRAQADRPRSVRRSAQAHPGQVQDAGGTLRPGGVLRDGLSTGPCLRWSSTSTRTWPTTSAVALVVVVKGFGRSPDEAVQALRMAHESMRRTAAATCWRASSTASRPSIWIRAGPRPGRAAGRRDGLCAAGAAVAAGCPRWARSARHWGPPACAGRATP